MISFRKKITRRYLFPCSLVVLYTLISGAAYCASSPFDEYAVFCSYFKLSRDTPSDQDVEELCFSFNRPTYTSFKPSEMFTKKSLLKEKGRIDEIITSITLESDFIWKVKCNLTNNKDIDKYFSMTSINEMLPQATPYINPKISGRGQRQIKKAISSLFKTHSENIKMKDVDIIITLRPEKSEYEYQKRNIVELDVVLPIRYVIFRPTKVQMLDELEMIN